MLPASALVALLTVAPATADGTSFAWPGSLAVDLAATSALPDTARLRAIEQLAVRGGPAFVPELVPLLRDPDAGVRLYAARRLARLGDPAAIQAARTWILTPAVPQVDRPFGLDVLRDAPSLPPEARRAVEQSLRDLDPAVRSLALDALDRHDLAPSLPAVLGALEDDNREVRLRAVRLAGASPDPRATLPLVGRVEDADRQVRLDAIRALGAHPDAAPVLARLVGESSDEARVAAVDALGATGAASFAPPLIELARRRPADELARHAQLALGRIGSPAAIAALVALTRIAPVSDETSAAIARAGGAAVPALIRELGSGTPLSAELAARSLGQIGDRRATSALAATLDARPALAPTALAALERIHDGAALPAVARAAEAPDARTRRAALDVLLALGDARGTAVIDRSLADPDAGVRARAAALAGALDARASARALLPLLSDADRQVRRAAASALARVGGPSRPAVAALIASLARPVAPLRDDDEWRTVGSALARLVDGDDGVGLARAFAAASGLERLALLRGLAAAGAERPLDEPGLAARLVQAVDEGGPVALAAAEALAATRPSDATRAHLARAFAAAAPAVQARLCPAIARAPEGGRWLAALVADPRLPDEVRAAAAWAARTDATARPALDAIAGGDGPVAANARAARAAGPSPGRTRLTEVVVRAPDGAAEAGRWLAISAPGGVEIWGMTDPSGAVRLEGLPDAPLAVRLPGSLPRSSEP